MTISVDSKVTKIVLPLVLFVCLGLVVFTVAARKTSEDPRGFAQETKVKVNYAPVVQNVPPLSAFAGVEYSYLLEVTDVDNSLEQIVASLVLSPSWMKLDGLRVYGTPSEQDVTEGIGTRVLLQISDGKNITEKSYYISVALSE